MSLAGNIAATGLTAAQQRIDTIAQNLANIKTTAYQKMILETTDLFYQQVVRAGIADNANGAVRPVGVEQGNGARVSAIYRSLKPGPISPTSNPLDLAIDGVGYFAVVLNGTNTQAYTRAGNLKIGADRRLTTVNGDPLVGDITIPEGVNINTIKIASDGTVTYKLPDGSVEGDDQIELHSFANDRGLEAIGNGLFTVTPASGEDVPFTGGSGAFGKIMQYALESSNVEVATELSDLIDAQRAYEFGVKVMQASDSTQKSAGEIYQRG